MKNPINNKKILFIVVSFLIFAIGFVLRLYPGKDHLIWDYDQARDSFEIRKIIQEKDIILIGPQAEKYGMFHGPLYYYYASIFYFISQGDPNLPMIAMVLLNLSTLIPIWLLVNNLFKNKKLAFFSAFFFAIAYEQIEYARWLSNVSITIPFIVWSYFLMWLLWQKKSINFRNINLTNLLLGFSLGLAIQGEIFLIYLIPFCYLILYLKKYHWKEWANYHLGLTLGLLPLVVAELKFNFQISKTFFNYFIALHSSESVSAGRAFLGYLDHMGFTAKNHFAGWSNSFGLYALILISIFTLATLFLNLNYYSKNIAQKNKTVERIKENIWFVFLLLFSHSITFSFHFVDAVFLNLGIGIPMIILITIFLYLIWQIKKPSLTIFLTLLFIFLQMRLLINNTQQNSPFNKFKFVQPEGILFKEKMDITKKAHEIAGGDKFSLAVIGTPYGVRTKWATTFEQFAKRNNTFLPVWFGYHANGYLGDDIFIPQDYPEEKHVLIIESQYNIFLDPYSANDFFEQQDEATNLISEELLYGHRIQLRVPKQKAHKI